MVARHAAELSRGLHQVPPDASTDEVFRTIAETIPMRAGFIDRFLQHSSSLGLLCPWHMEPQLVEQIMTARAQDTPAVLGVVAATPRGRLVRHRDIARVIDWSEVVGYQALLAFGLAEPAAVKIGDRSCGSDREHIYLALIQEADQPPLSPLHEKILRLVWRDIDAAFRRVRIPLLAAEPLLLQVAQERRMGLALCTAAGEVVQTNYLAHRHARDYLAVRRRGAKTRENDPAALAREALAQTRASGLSWQLAHASEPKTLRVDRHWLSRGVHDLANDMLLLVTQEFEVGRLSSGHAVLRHLSPRLQETARYLVHTGLSYAQIAEAMSIREGTVRKHVERLYRQAGVSSRRSLTRLLGR